MREPTHAPDGAQSLPELADQDPQRPRFHFVAPGGWLNDPNGMCQREGVYHLFYQYNPHAPVHHRIHWGHATSRDLVTWTDEPVALVPDDEGPDRDGCWSGVVVDDDGVPTIVYSGHHDDRELPCVAVGSADLRTWVKDPGNPVIAATPPGADVHGFRDHCVWREDGRWRHLVGSGLRGRGGTAYLYESDDLRDWRLVGPLVEPAAPKGVSTDPDWAGTMWECVDLFRPPVEDSADADVVAAPDVLVFSAWDEGVTHHPLYWTGRYEGDTFTPERLHRLDLGGRYFYAPQSMRDRSGRRILFAWMQEGRPDEAATAAGWSGAMSLPRQAVLGADGRLHQSPVDEVTSLRGEPTEWGGQALPLGESLRLAEGDQLDVEITLRLTPGALVQVTMREAEDGRERTVLQLARGTVEASGSVDLVLDRSRSSLDPSVDGTPRSGPVPVGEEGRVDVRVLVDHSALEVFVNGRPLTARVYPTLPHATGVSLELVSGEAMLERAVAWPMRDIWDGPRELWP